MTTPTKAPQGALGEPPRAPATSTPQDRNRAAIERLLARERDRATAALEQQKVKARKLAAARSRKAREARSNYAAAMASASKRGA